MKYFVYSSHHPRPERAEGEFRGKILNKKVVVDFFKLENLELKYCIRIKHSRVV
jgi:hypothetical protein